MSLDSTLIPGHWIFNFFNSNPNILPGGEGVQSAAPLYPLRGLQHEGACIPYPLRAPSLREGTYLPRRAPGWMGEDSHALRLHHGYCQSPGGPTDEPTHRTVPKVLAQSPLACGKSCPEKTPHGALVSLLSPFPDTQMGDRYPRGCALHGIKEDWRPYPQQPPNAGEGLTPALRMRRRWDPRPGASLMGSFSPCLPIQRSSLGHMGRSGAVHHLPPLWPQIQDVQSPGAGAGCDGHHLPQVLRPRG